MTNSVDVFFYSYYLNADFLRQLGSEPLNPRRARLYRWQLYLGGENTTIKPSDSFADGMIYSLTEAELLHLYQGEGIEKYTPQTLEVELLDTNKQVSVSCYIAPIPETATLPTNPYHVALLLNAMRSYGLNTQDIEQVYWQMIKPLVLHIPHSSTLIPSSYRQDFVLSDAQLQPELLHMTDWYTDELFDLKGTHVSTLRFPVSRLLLDPERFVDDEAEPMAARGMGVVYTKTSTGAPLRVGLTSKQKQHLVDEFYLPHHQTLTEQVEQHLTQYGSALIIDCHSFPSKALPYELNQTAKRPDICLGADDFHTPSELMDLVAKLFEQQGFTVAVNEPFAGSIVPTKFYCQDKRVHSLMIEVNRRLYTDENTGAKSASFNRVQGVIHNVLSLLSESHD